MRADELARVPDRMPGRQHLHRHRDRLRSPLRRASRREGRALHALPPSGPAARGHTVSRPFGRVEDRDRSEEALASPQAQAGEAALRACTAQSARSAGGTAAASGASWWAASTSLADKASRCAPRPALSSSTGACSMSMAVSKRRSSAPTATPPRPCDQFSVDSKRGANPSGAAWAQNLCASGMSGA